MEIEARERWVLEWVLGGMERRETVCVCRPPLSIMKANQLGWQRRVLQEESQSTEPNEPRLEIREAQKKERE